MSVNVYLIGAGPGDPGLITLKGAEVLKRADVVIYDRLANPALLKLAPETAECINVGKLPGRQRLKQAGVIELLVEKGKAGQTAQTVVRLKGGDPFVFAHGAEEGEALRAAGISFEVIPGITSVLAVPAYAGIPVTHREVGPGFTVISAHHDPAVSSLDYDALAKFAKNTTLIILMGVRTLPKVVAALTKGGLPLATPVATTQWGTHSQQRTATGTLGTIVSEVEKHAIKSPAVTIIGQVVTYRETLRWFDRLEQRPLLGTRVVVTRARQQASSFSHRLWELGAEAIELPAIRIAPPADDYAALDQAITELAQYDWILFTSVNGVHHFWQRLIKMGKDARQLAHLRIAAIGSATAQALQQYSIMADLIPKEFVAESLLEALSNEGITNQHFLLPRADIARQALPQGLRAAGAHVTEVDAYRTVLGQPDAHTIASLQDGVEIITFTSSSTVRNFMALLAAQGMTELIEHAIIATIGPITTRTAHELGLSVAIQAEPYTIAGLIEAIVKWKNAQATD